MKTTQPVKDNRPGYLRQAEEPVTITCECGARVLERHMLGQPKELIHVGPCSVVDTETSK